MNPDTKTASIASQDGFLSDDGSDFVKKGTHSAGVACQHCGRLGKTEDCQVDVFVSYASEKDYGLVNSQLYIPKEWFSEGFHGRRLQCKIPESAAFGCDNAF